MLQDLFSPVIDNTSSAEVATSAPMFYYFITIQNETPFSNNVF